MPDPEDRPRVGIGVVIVNHQEEILIGKRTGSHAPYYSIPGGNLDPGETFEGGGRREIKEETNLDIENPEVIAVTNNLDTYRCEGLHYISIILLVKNFSGELKNREPEKCAGWFWADPKNLPEPLFEASRKAVACYLEKTFYKKAE